MNIQKIQFKKFPSDDKKHRYKKRKDFYKLIELVYPEEYKLNKELYNEYRDR